MSTVIINAPDDRSFHQWHIKELYFGDTPTGEVFRPNVGDMVTDPDIGIYEVVSVNEESIPTLELKTRFSSESLFNVNSTSLITALSHYQPSSVTRAFINKSTSPYTVNIDGRYLEHGSESTTMVFFRGTDTSEDGEVISEVYNSNGTLIGTQIQLIEISPGLSTSKRPGTFKTSKEIDAGEVITGVVYTADGGKFSTQPFLVSETGIARSTNYMDKHIVAVSLKGDAMSTTEDDLIVNYVGTPLSSLLLKGVLHYSDGSTIETNINGSKMVLHGLDDFDTSFVGRPSNVVLSYYPSSSEPYINGGIGEVASISAVYRLSNITEISSYTLKVFVLPVWNADAARYTFEYRLMNMEGDLDVDVTAYVRVVRESDDLAISGTDFAVKQNIRLSLDMALVSPVVYSGYIHTQKFDITLDDPSAISGQTWLIDYVGDGTNIYGQNILASITSEGDELLIDQGMSSSDEWLTKLFYSVEPLYDPEVLSRGPTPTHFIIEYKGEVSGKIPLSSWADNIDKPDNMESFSLTDTVSVQWVLETAEGDNILGVTPIYIKNYYV